MKNRLRKISVLTGALALVAAAVAVGAYLALTPQTTQAYGPGSHWGFPDIRAERFSPPNFSADDVQGKPKKFQWHKSGKGAYGFTDCPVKVGFLGTYHTISEPAINPNGPPGKRLLRVPIRIGNNQLCGQHTVYFATKDNEHAHRAEYDKDYEPVADGKVVFEQGQRVAHAEVWITGDKIIEDQETFDLYITGMTWDDTGYKDVVVQRNKNVKDIVKTAAEGQAAARGTAGSPKRKISVYPELQVARVRINSLHQNSDGWTKQGEKRPRPALVSARSLAQLQYGIKTFEGQKAKIRVTAAFRGCAEDVTADYVTRETPYQASKTYKDYVESSGTVTVKAGQDLGHTELEIKTLADHSREDVEYFDVQFSNLRGGCSARFAGNTNGNDLDVARVHIHDASPADAPLEQALTDVTVIADNVYTTDGDFLRFNVDISHEVDEEIVIHYETVSQYSAENEWQAKPKGALQRNCPPCHYSPAKGTLTFPPRDETRSRVVEARTAYRNTSQPQLIQSVNLKLTVRKGPAVQPANQAVGLIYDRQYQGEKTADRLPQQYNPPATPGQPGQQPTPTPTPTPTPKPDTPRPEPTSKIMQWGTGAVTVAEDGRVEVPIKVPAPLYKDVTVEVKLSTTPRSGSSNLPTGQNYNETTGSDAYVAAQFHRWLVTDPTRPNPDKNLYLVNLRKGFSGELNIPVKGIPDGLVEGSEVLYLNFVKFRGSDRFIWNGDPTVQVIIEDKDALPGVVPSLEFIKHENFITETKPGRSPEEIVLEGDKEWWWGAKVKFDPPLPVDARVKAIVRCKICTEPGWGPVKNLGIGISDTNTRIVAKKGSSEVDIPWKMIGNTKHNPGWDHTDKLLQIFVRIEGDGLFLKQPFTPRNAGLFNWRIQEEPYPHHIPEHWREAFPDYHVAEYRILRDDDPPNALAIHTPDPKVEGKTLRFRVTREGDATDAVTVNYSTHDGTALAGVDYEAASGTLTIPTGETEGKIEVHTISDPFAEPTETFTVKLSGGDAVVKTATGNIVDQGSLTDFINMTLGEPRANDAGDLIMVPVYINPDRLIKHQRLQFQWGVSDEESFGDAAYDMSAPPKPTLMGYITLRAQTASP